MSTRWYPIYQRGNPQLRVFLPNFWMKLVKTKEKLPPNMVQFLTSVEMTHHDVKSYLQKIYNVNVVDVNTEIKLGKFKRQTGANKYVIKEDDYKVATVTLPKNEVFEFPDLFPDKEQNKSEKKQIEEAKAFHKNSQRMNSERPGVPGWFSY